jgi:glycosyltransferase involved in cell wall biosynthesis
LASRKSAKHYVSTCHGFFKPRLSRKLFDSWGDKVIAISAPVKAHLEIDFSIPPERIELIHNGVDLKRFSRIYSAEDITNLKRSIGLKDGPVVGTMGRLSSVKGQRFLVEAMRHLIIKKPDVQCLIIGGGPEEDALKSLAKSLGVEGSIKFAGSVYKDIASYLACIDVFVLPSIKEGLGLALLEAMAASRPCVASDIGGISDIVINGRNGLLAPVANGVAIADTVMNLLNDKALSARLAAEGNKYVKENFSVESMAQKMFKLYNGVVREKK